MDDFELLLATSMKRAAEQRPDLERSVASPQRRHVGVQLVAVAACTTVAVGLGLFIANHGNERTPTPNVLHRSQYPPTPPAGDIAVWTLAPHQHLSRGSTAFVALVSRLGCNSGLTGDVFGPGVIATQHSVTVAFTVRHSNGGFCPGNNLVPVTVRLGSALGSRALVDGQCSDTEASTTAFCVSDRGVRWSGRNVATVRGTLTDAEFAVALRVAKAEQATITGTFVGATATAHVDRFKKDCPSGNTLHIRLVWERNANFDHGGLGLPDGPRKALELFADPKTGQVCRTAARFRDVGASPNETLLYGTWPDPRRG